MIAFLMVFFVILCVFLAIAILIQPGKGDMGLGSLSGSSQMLFGGSGGKDFFEKTTWTMGALFIFGALGLAILKSKETSVSHISKYSSQTTQTQTQIPTKPVNPMPVQPVNPMPAQPVDTQNETE